MNSTNILSALNEDFSDASNDTVDFDEGDAAQDTNEQINDTEQTPEIITENSERYNENDQLADEPSSNPRPSRPGTFGKRRKSVLEIESLSTYKLKNTALRPASSYAKPAKVNPVNRKIISAPENIAAAPSKTDTNPNIKQVKETSNPLPRKPYDPKNEVIAISKVKERIYERNYLDANNKIKLLAAGKITKEQLKEDLATPSTSSEGDAISVKQRLFNRPLKKSSVPKETFDTNANNAKDTKKTAKVKTGKGSAEKSDKSVSKLQKKTVEENKEKSPDASDKSDEIIRSKDKQKRKKNVIKSSESETDSNEIELSAAPKKLTNLREELTRKRGRPKRLTSPVPEATNRKKSLSKSPEKEAIAEKSPDQPEESSEKPEDNSDPGELIKSLLAQFMQNYIEGKATEDQIKLAKKIFGAKYDSTIKTLDLQKAELEAQKESNRKSEKDGLPNGEPALNNCDKTETDIEKVMEELHTSPVKRNLRSRRNAVDSIEESFGSSNSNSKSISDFDENSTAGET